MSNVRETCPVLTFFFYVEPTHFRHIRNQNREALNIFISLLIFLKKMLVLNLSRVDTNHIFLFLMNSNYMF